MERRAASAADFPRRVLDAQPMTSRDTLRIQTLHRATGQILHNQFASQISGTGGWKG